MSDESDEMFECNVCNVCVCVCVLLKKGVDLFFSILFYQSYQSYAMLCCLYDLIL